MRELIDNDDNTSPQELRQRYLSGRLSEFPDGQESSDMIWYVHTDQAHPTALDGRFTGGEWAIIAALREEYDVWSANTDGEIDAEGILERAYDRIGYYLQLEADDWNNTLEELTRRFAGGSMLEMLRSGDIPGTN